MHIIYLKKLTTIGKFGTGCERNFIELISFKFNKGLQKFMPIIIYYNDEFRHFSQIEIYFNFEN